MPSQSVPCAPEKPLQTPGPCPAFPKAAPVKAPKALLPSYTLPSAIRAPAACQWQTPYRHDPLLSSPFLRRHSGTSPPPPALRDESDPSFPVSPEMSVLFPHLQENHPFLPQPTSAVPRRTFPGYSAQPCVCALMSSASFFLCP